MSSFTIPEFMIAQVCRQAEDEYPKECCGLIFGDRQNKEALTFLKPCRNIQEAQHRLDPETFPRTAETAFYIAPEEILQSQKEARARGCELRVIYHSHVDAEAYFSEEDKRFALPGGEPAYPGVRYWILSVKKRKVEQSKIFHWDFQRKDFVS